MQFPLIFKPTFGEALDVVATPPNLQPSMVERSSTSRTKKDVGNNRRRHEQYARNRLPVVALTIVILKSSPTFVVPLQHSDACIRQPCEVGNGPVEGL
jgi:hypothetical protein